MSWILKRLGDRFGQSLRLPTPSAPKKSEKALLIRVWESVFLKEDTIIDSNTRLVGNKEGLGWMERMERETRAQRNMIDQLANKIQGQQITITQLKADSKAQKIINEEQNRMWFEVRAIDIEDGGHSQAQEATLARSEGYRTIHRGNIIEDLEIVEFMKAKTPQDRYESLRVAFESLYEVSLRYKHRIVHAPDLVLRTFNILADTKSYWGWPNDSITQDEARTICRGIIRRWLEFVDAGEGEYPEDEIKGEFEKLKAPQIHVQECVFQTEDTIINSNTRPVGNKEGFSLMDRLDRLDDTHDQIETELGGRKMTMDQLGDELREQRNLLERLLNKVVWVSNKVEERQNVIDRIANKFREQREVSERHLNELKTLRKWWFPKC